MPHQCLKCGSLFDEGSTTILRGCPDCAGTRFYYTKEPLTVGEREGLLQRAVRDLSPLLEKIAGEAQQRKEAPPPPTAPAAAATPKPRGHMGPDGKLTVKVTRGLKRRVERASTGWDYDAPTPVPAPARERELDAPATRDVVYRRPSVEDPRPGTWNDDPKAEAPAPEPAAVQIRVTPDQVTGQIRPETVHIPDLGQYEIDVQRLLEKSPIVVQRDGSYTIHLASLFESGRPGKP